MNVAAQSSFTSTDPSASPHAAQWAELIHSHGVSQAEAAAILASPSFSSASANVSDATSQAVLPPINAALISLINSGVLTLAFRAAIEQELVSHLPDLILVDSNLKHSLRIFCNFLVQILRHEYFNFQAMLSFLSWSASIEFACSRHIVSYAGPCYLVRLQGGSIFH